jgi:hypothetical protein
MQTKSVEHTGLCTIYRHKRAGAHNRSEARGFRRVGWESFIGTQKPATGDFLRQSK